MPFRPRLNTLVITPSLQITGQMEPAGSWIDFLNSRDKHTFSLYSARLMSIGGASSVVEREQVTVNRHLIYLLAFPEMGVRETIPLMRNAVTAIFHAGSILCRGDIHMGMDTSLAVFLDEFNGEFIPVTDASLHSTIAMPAALPKQLDVALLNRSQIQVYFPA